MKHLLKPIKIGTLELKNRMVQPGMGTNLAARDGTVSDSIAAYYLRRAHGGAGLIITEVCCPEARGRVIPGELEISDNSFIPGLSRLTAGAHAGGAKIFLQIAHGGCFASQGVTGVQPISPSGIGTALLPDDNPRSMTPEEIGDITDAYAAAAVRARMAGFDGVEIHGAHGYLPLQFLSAYTNKRKDHYGGSLENRARFALEIIGKIRARTGTSFPVIYRLSAMEDVPGGVTPEEAALFASMLEKAGIDALHVTAGTWDSRMAAFSGVLQDGRSPEGKRLSHGISIGMWVPPVYVPRGNLIPLARRIKERINLPVIGVCGVSPEMGEQLIEDGYVDLIAMGRQMIADPDTPRKVKENRLKDIRRCVRCNECLGSVLSYKGLTCTVNPGAAREAEIYTPLVPVSSPLEVAVIGGGPAGMEAAATAARRGHKVTLYEAEQELGGLLRLISLPEFKKDYRLYLDYLVNRVKSLNITVKTGTRATPELIKASGADRVIFAPGGSRKMLTVKGGDLSCVYNSLDVLKGRIPEAGQIIVAGGGIVAAELALYLREEHNKQVTIVEQLPALNLSVETFTRWVVQARLAEREITVKVGHRIEEITGKEVICYHENQKIILPSSGVVNALGFQPANALIEIFRQAGLDILPVGDAAGIRNVLAAVHEGYHAGRLV